MARMKFRATLDLHGKTATGISVPADVVEDLGGGKRPAVTVTLGKHTYRSTIAPMSGKHFLPVSAEHREAAGLAAGDEVDVAVELDTAKREVEVPDDLASALTKNARARAAFEALSYSNQRRYVLAINGAKAEETRARRIAKTVEELSG
jgi:hypothetical protein